MRSFNDVCKEVGFSREVDWPKQQVVFYGYAKGSCLGAFQSVSEAKNNGALTTERSIVNEAEIEKFEKDYYDKKEYAETTWYNELLLECSRILAYGGSSTDTHKMAATVSLSYVTNRCQYDKDTVADYAIEECELFFKIMKALT